MWMGIANIFRPINYPLLHYLKLFQLKKSTLILQIIAFLKCFFLWREYINSELREKLRESETQTQYLNEQVLLIVLRFK